MKVLKWLGMVLAGLVLVGVVGYQVVKAKARTALDKKWDVQPKEVPVPWPLSAEELERLKAEGLEARKAELAAQLRAQTPDGKVPSAAELERRIAEAQAALDPDAVFAERYPREKLDATALEQAVARGKTLVDSRLGCFECHGDDYGGKVIMDDPAAARWVAPNITRAGKTKDYAGRDWVRILRHGVNQDGSTSSMPAIDYTWLSDREISDVAAYIGSRPEVTRELPATELGPIFTMAIGLGQMQLAPYVIDHQSPRPELPPSEEKPTLELGKHLVGTCVGCHHTTFSGGKRPDQDPSWPTPANLTPHETGLKGWTQENFAVAMREGRSRDGRALSEVMPSRYFKALSDVQLEAMWMYLQSLPPTPIGSN